MLAPRSCWRRRSWHGRGQPHRRPAATQFVVALRSWRRAVPCAVTRRLDFSNGAVDIGRRQHPVVIEIGDDLAHKRRAEADGALLRAEMFDENGKGELLGTITLVGPLESPGGEAFGLVVLIEPSAIDGDDQTIDGALAFKGAHGLPPPPKARDISPIEPAAIDPLAAANFGRIATSWRRRPHFARNLLPPIQPRGPGRHTRGVNHVSPRPLFALRR